MKLWIASVAVLGSALVGAAPPSPRALVGAAPPSPRAELVARDDPSLTPARPGPPKQPLKSSCNNECLELNYVETGCAHAHDWMCLCVEFEGGEWNLANSVQQCFLSRCFDSEDMISWRSIIQGHCIEEVRALAKFDVWRTLQEKQEREAMKNGTGRLLN